MSPLLVACRMRVLAALFVTVLVAGCNLPGPAPLPTPTDPTIPTVTLPTVTVPTLTPPPEEPYVPVFDGERAMGWVRAQVVDAQGQPRYRVPGTPGNAEVAQLIADNMSAMGYTSTWHFFNGTYGCEEVPMHNVVAERAGTTGRIVVFAAHYDTRPIADKDPDASRRDEPILGANDGASGVGVLLELARVLPPSNDTVRFLFFDGEDGGGYKGRACTDWILGSRAYAESLSEEEVRRIDALVLVDMIGDPELQLPREGYSANDERARPVQDEIYRLAKELGHPQFLDQVSYPITDDHVPFLERMVPAVDLIHLLPGDRRIFPGWHHTHDDDLDVVSAESLDAVGETVEAWFVARGR